MATKTVARAINRQIRELQRERKAWLAGEFLHWGMAWCTGGELCRKPDPCEGCMNVAVCREKAHRIGEQITDLKAQLPGARRIFAQVALF
ncbi:hypothetical protein ACFOSC_26610 [Streptantibioticus rubrisoli]|uniref:Uncharacterized protein n=1 Tax=Streptantibioticus rubrisoli TaxID=1387313 RepID=A0ABT1PEQ0_9ACTN|nr:hypothetical protein [Streptantibioticus rubrisoli]MCQ4043853.1 hypothetical protein [Streptantibioticus rubrisoli]